MQGRPKRLQIEKDNGIPLVSTLKWSMQVADRAGRLVLPSPNGCRGENPVYSDSLEELEEMLLEDILNPIDCQPEAEMK